MSWEEALQAMREGKRVKNKHFCDGEWFEMHKGSLYAEDGCSMYGWYTGESWQKTGWSIIQADRP
ncbi:hypothetical protein Erwinia_phage_Fougasse_00070 [Erwinia phage Fougasse]|nr:hypothetical protein Erwinia_phage_Berlingot_00063 [Erwinia phage Berlingot]WJN63862.1 hypothetical protein Erwinia_phage_Calisson_00059 [Erwinia phage Calisson]WJN63948.1 hypothetical protein Erwinia_phage_Farigoule_00061 [Erwinia phage Farigoule]WJN64033.1 hypothetical protein Erwinia_phage_Fougasse_00070 [Erwinia phage Fougasse]WJN64106.1 hypothetical protein Erwinia_phage_Mauresque_00064 [Erwinia phage Mauresque]WJN64182.1 hypothetical protein Erwinia_phage_Navette_00062 [Erwinia phage 